MSWDPRRLETGRFPPWDGFRGLAEELYWRGFAAPREDDDPSCLSFDPARVAELLALERQVPRCYPGGP